MVYIEYRRYDVLLANCLRIWTSGELCMHAAEKSLLHAYCQQFNVHYSELYSHREQFLQFQL